MSDITPKGGLTHKILMPAFNVKQISKESSVCEGVHGAIHTPVGAPWDGGNKANIRKKDGIIFDAIQGIMHLTEWQSVQLELELHLKNK